MNIVKIRIPTLLILASFLVGMPSEGAYPGDGKTYQATVGQLFTMPSGEHITRHYPEYYSIFRKTSSTNLDWSSWPAHGWIKLNFVSQGIQPVGNWRYIDYQIGGTPSEPGSYYVNYHTRKKSDQTEDHTTFTIEVADGSGIIAITPSGQNVASGGASQTISVTARTAWSASTSAGWITLNSAGGNGNGSIAYSVAENTSTANRSGIITVGSFTHTVTQAGKPLFVTLSPTSASFSRQGGSGSITVVSNTAWSAVSNINWLRVTSGSAGNENGSISYSVDPWNAVSNNTRSGQIRVGGSSFTITQSGEASYVTVTPTSSLLDWEGGSVEVIVNSNSDWQLSGTGEWVTTSLTQGSDSKRVVISALENPTRLIRSRVISIGSANFTLTQAAAPPPITIEPSSLAVPYTGEEVALRISATSEWRASTKEPWVKILDQESGFPEGALTIQVAPNGTDTDRRGVVRVNADTLTILQLRNPTEVAPLVVELSHLGGPETITIRSPGPWTATSENEWITISNPVSGPGSAILEFVADTNPRGVSRLGKIIINHKPISIIQEANPTGLVPGVYIFGDDYSLSPRHLNGPPQQLAAGGSHSLFLSPDGHVFAWGVVDSENYLGELSQLTGIRAIAASLKSSAVVRNDGTVQVFGVEPGSDIQPPSDLTGVVSIAAGQHHFLALKQDKTVVAWGNPLVPAATAPQGLENIVGIATYGRFNLVLKDDGTVVQWGEVGTGPKLILPPDLSNVSRIACGLHFGMALQDDGEVVTWGSTGLSRYSISPPPDLHDVIKIAAGEGHALALKRNGTVVAWGSNLGGQTLVPEGLSKVIDIGAGGGHSLATLEDGTLIAWGNGFQASPPKRLENVKTLSLNSRIVLASFDDGTIGGWGVDPKGGPELWAGLNDIQSVAVGGGPSVSLYGGNQRVALRSDGTVVEWGRNQIHSQVPTDLAGVTAIAAGSRHTLALEADGTVTAWGESEEGAAIVPPGLAKVRKIAAHGQRSMVLLEDGAVRVWGGEDAWIPEDLPKAVSIATGDRHSLALLENGDVRAWGDGSLLQTAIPDGLKNVVAIAAGSFHSVALKADGTVSTWGYQGGSPTGTVEELMGVTGISAGGYRTAATVGMALPDPDIEIKDSEGKPLLSDVSTISFDSLVVNDHQEMSYILSNIGSWNLSGISIAIAGQGSQSFEIGNSTLTPNMVAGTSAEFKIKFLPLTIGSQHATLQVLSNDSDEGSIEIYLTGKGVTARTAFDETLANTSSLIGADATPEAIPFKDGIPNILKYAFNMGLSVPGVEILSANGSSGLPSGQLVEIEGQSYWRVEYVRRKGSGLIYLPEKSNDLTSSSFEPLTGNVTVIDIDSQWERVQVDEPCDLDSTSRCFSHVKVTMQ